MGPRGSRLPALREDASGEVDKLTRFAATLDSAFRIPFTRIEFGLDALIGLVPGIGDLAGALLSLTIVYRSWRLGVGGKAIVRMLGNVAVDFFVGAIPVAGDIVDVFWQGNQRNIALLRRELGLDDSGPDSCSGKGNASGTLTGP